MSKFTLQLHYETPLQYINILIEEYENTIKYYEDEIWGNFPYEYWVDQYHNAQFALLDLNEVKQKLVGKQ